MLYNHIETIPSDLKPIITATDCVDPRYASDLKELGKRQADEMVTNTMIRTGIELQIGGGDKPIGAFPEWQHFVGRMGTDRYTPKDISGLLDGIGNLARVVLDIGPGTDPKAVFEVMQVARERLGKKGIVVFSSSRPSKLVDLAQRDIVPDVWQHRLGISSTPESSGERLKKALENRAFTEQILQGSELCFGDRYCADDDFDHFNDCHITERMAQKTNEAIKIATDAGHNVVLDACRELSFQGELMTTRRLIEKVLRDFFEGNAMLYGSKSPQRVTGIRACRPLAITFDDNYLRKLARKIQDHVPRYRMPNQVS